MGAELIFTSESDPIRRIPLEPGKPYVLGRSRSCDVVLTGTKVSRQHTRVRFLEGRLSVEDLGSRNGTYVQGQRLGKRPATLQNGEAFQVGRSRVTLRALDTLFEDSLLGPVLPGYQPVAPIGKGSFATVFSAIDERSGRIVAVKKLKARHEEDLARFEREARLMTQLDDPHLVKIFDFVYHQSNPHIVMEFVDGETLQRKTRGAGLPLQQVIAMGHGLLQGLTHLHAAGIVHRDLKPSNVLLPYSSGVKLTDLGIAKALEEDTGLTSEGQGLGTFGYMPPEQATNAKLADHRSDLYGLGATLYYCLTARPPLRFKRIESQASLREAVHALQTRAPVPLSVHRPDTPEWLELTVMRLLSKAPEERGEASDLLEVFEERAAVYDGDDLDETWI